MASCSNTSDLETGEIRVFQLLKDILVSSSQSKSFIDARTILNRQQIDEANIPILFIELASGQNGTLTPYPGQGMGQTWLGADGAIVTLHQGVLMASRGMGNDIMGSSSSMPLWSKIHLSETYIRKLRFITGNNKVSKRVFECSVLKKSKKEVIKIWDANFIVSKFEEHCNYNGLKINNVYYVDSQEIVRRSLQYHSETIGYVTIERLDR